MPPPETDSKTIEAQITAERLQQWKDRRAKIAETSRIERLRQAEDDRRARLEQAEKDRETRVREAADRRARQIAQEKADRLESARAKLVGRAEIDAARERLVHYRTRTARAFAWRMLAFIIVPTALVAAYLFTVATPLYEAQTILAVRAANTPITTQDRPVFALPAGTEAAHQVRAVMLSDPTLRGADGEAELAAHYGAEAMDPLRRLRDMSAVQLSQTDQLRRYISADVRAFEGLITLSVLARTPKDATTFSQAIINQTHKGLATISQSHKGRLITVVPPTASEVATSPGRLGGTLLAALIFAGLYAGISIFLSTLRRHAWT